MIEFLLTATPGAVPALPGGAAGGVDTLDTLWEFVEAGGPAMALIALCSLVALAVIVERSILLRRRNVVPPRLLAELEAAGGDTARAIDAARKSSSPLGNVVLAALQRRHLTLEAQQNGMEEAGRREIIRLRKRMRLLGGLPQVATMLGLLGTIFGMITTFQTIAFSGESLGKTELLAKGIFEAWTCTAGGLIVAIPVLIAFHTLMGRVEALMVELDKAAEDWFMKEQSAGRAGGPAHRAPHENGSMLPRIDVPVTVPD